MKLRLIRNATLLLDYAGHHILIDPYFAPKLTLPSFTGKSMNPLVDLPIPPEQILDGVELVIVSHLHTDHFDPVAQQLIPKDWPLYCQPGNEGVIRSKSFQQVMPITDSVEWQGISIMRIGGHHGTGEVETAMGTVSGFVFRAAGEPTVYWAGDTILCSEVQDAIAHYQPDIVVTHSCGANWPNNTGQRDLIVMDAEQTVEVCRLAKLVIAVHMESLDHGTVSRAELRSHADQAGVDAQCLLIPADGEMLEFPV